MQKTVGLIMLRDLLFVNYTGLLLVGGLSFQHWGLN
jgi:hypothetical protein